jgi:outer membrane lipoprotein-sorting protein
MSLLRKLSLLLTISSLLSVWACAQDQGGMEAALTAMDKSAAKFQNAEADFTWDQYQKVVNDTDTQKGQIYFRRAGTETQMAVDVQQPDKKYVLYSNGKIQLYQPSINQVNVYEAGKNQSDAESFLVLGFGGRGHDLAQRFVVKYEGTEDVDGVKAAKFDLTPKSQRVLNMFNRIVLWVDTERDVSIKQQLFEPSGDYRTAHYTNIKVNSKIPDSVFKLKTSGKTKTVNGS